jgi:CRISPR-associated protein Cmr2
LNTEKNKLEKEKDNQSKQALQLLNNLELTLKQQRFYQQNTEPLSYMVIMAADGDRMGELLDAMQSVIDHRNISKKLTEFANQVPGIVRNHRGHCVYAGGDDVLALLPLDKAIECSRKLADIFKQIIENVEGITDYINIQIPTLSVGLGISHFMTPMPKQLDLARKAEKLAKSNDRPKAESKNALAIIFQPRSGAAISFRERWDYDNQANSAETILNNWIQAHRSELIPRQAGYNLREQSNALDWCNDKPEYTALIKAETRRILERKRVNNSEGSENTLDEQHIEAICERAGSAGLRKTADELIMTYRFAQACQQAEKTTTEVEHD